MSFCAVQTVESTAFRDAVSLHAAGVAVVTSTDEHGAPVGMTVSTFASHSVSPPTVSCDLAVTTRTLAAIRQGRRFAVHLLSEDQEKLALRFATDVDRFDADDWGWDDGLPALWDVVARFDCELLTDVEVGDHAVVLGTVTDVTAEPGRAPLVHQARAFRPLR